MMTIDKVLLGQAIAQVREARGITQSQLNKMISMSTIQHIEQGINSVSMTCLNKIAVALKIPVPCLVLLGTRVDKSDKVLSSLRSLMMKSLVFLSEKEEPPKEKKRVAVGNQTGKRIIAKEKLAKKAPSKRVSSRSLAPR
jgi:transcriptional regulator with XRE-family HTH domain